jgi:hypothetical protein
MSRTNVFRDDRVHVQAAKCSTCIYRPGNLMKLEPGRREQMEDDAIRDGGVIPCHQTIEAYTGSDGDESVCRGFFDVAKHEGDALLSVAERMGLVVFTDLPTQESCDTITS